MTFAAMVNSYLEQFRTERENEARTTLLLMLDVARAQGEAKATREMGELVRDSLKGATA